MSPYVETHTFEQGIRYRSYHLRLVCIRQVGTVYDHDYLWDLRALPLSERSRIGKISELSNSPSVRVARTASSERSTVKTRIAPTYATMGNRVDSKEEISCERDCLHREATMVRGHRCVHGGDLDFFSL